MKAISCCVKIVKKDNWYHIVICNYLGNLSMYSDWEKDATTKNVYQ